MSGSYRSSRVLGALVASCLVFFVSSAQAQEAEQAPQAEPAPQGQAIVAPRPEPPPVVVQREPIPPAARGEVAADTLTPREALAQIDLLEDELDTLDTTAPNALLIAGIAAAVVGAGLVAGAVAVSFSDRVCSDFSRDRCGQIAMVTPGAILLVGGLAMLTVGAAWLPSLNAQRRRLERRIDDYRRFLPSASLRLMPQASAEGGGLVLSGSF